MFDEMFDTRLRRVPAAVPAGPAGDGGDVDGGIMLTVGSLFTGVGGFDMGLERAGMRVAWQVEIDPQARAVLRRHWPDVALHEDVRTVGRHNLEPVDVVCGGFPCQDLSVAGRRAGLAGERSGLFYEFMRIVDELAPRWVLIENVPGLLSSNGGRDMGAVLGTLGELGYGYAYRVLDLQHFGVPQRRRRVFIVGRAGGFCPPEVLLEPESLPGDPAARGEAGEGVAAGLTTRAGNASRPAGGNGNIVAPLTTKPYADHEAQESKIVAYPLTAREHKGPASSVDSGNIVAYQCQGSNVGEMGTLRRGNGNETGGVPFVADTLVAGGRELPPHGTGDGKNIVAHTLRAEGHDASEDGTGRGTPIVAVPLQEVGKRTGKSTTDPRAGIGIGADGDPMYSLRGGRTQSIVHAVPRRLTPRECERLMGWPDDWTRYGVTDDGREVEMADGPRYRMCGNGVGGLHSEWIGLRIVAADAASRKEDAA